MRLTSGRASLLARAILYGVVVATGGLAVDFAVNVLTGSSLPGPLDRYRWLALPTVVVAFIAGVAAAVRERLGRSQDEAGAAAGDRPEGHLPDLPPVARDFTGRTRELEALRALLPPAETRARAAPVVVTIHGPMGVGKSMLAIRFAHDVSRSYPDAQFYLNLVTSGGPPVDTVEALRRLLRGMGAVLDLPLDLDGLSDLYRSRMRGSRVVVVLDHAESEAQVQPLLADQPGCLTLITSQQPLDGLPHARPPVRLNVMSDDEAVTLLSRIAGDHVRSLEHEPDTREVVALCGHLPLALSIAGVLLRRNPRRSVRDLVSQMTDVRGRLEVLHAGNLDVRASFDVSYAHLSQMERALFRRLSLVPQPSFGAELAAALLGCPPPEAERLLERLVDEQVLEMAGDRLYGFQNLIGLYAREKLEREEPPAEQRAAQERALRISIGTAMRQAMLLDSAVLEVIEGVADPPAPVSVTLEAQLAALDWLELERANLVLVAGQAALLPGDDVAWRLAAGLGLFFDLRGYWMDWKAVQEAARISAHPDGSLKAQAWSALGTGQILGLDRHYDEALAHLQESLETALAGRWPRVAARAQYLMGRVEHERGRYGVAIQRYGRAATTFQDEGMRAELSSTLFYVAVALFDDGALRAEEVVRLGESVLATLADEPEQLWTLRTTGRINECFGHVAERLGDLEGAGTFYLRSGEAFSKTFFRHGHGRVRRNLGRIRMQQGHFDRALEILAHSLTLFSTIGDRYQEAQTQVLLGEAQHSLGRRPEAKASWQAALTTYAEVGTAAEPEASAVRARLESA